MVSRPSSLTTDSYVKINSPLLPLDRQQKTTALQSKANSHKRIEGAQYKYFHDKNVHIEPNPSPNQRMFVDKSPLLSGSNTADGMAKTGQNKLLPC